MSLYIMIQYYCMGASKHLAVVCIFLTLAFAGINQDARSQFRGLPYIEVSNTNAFERGGTAHIARYDANMLGLVYIETEANTSTVYYALSPNNGKTWTKPLNISIGQSIAREPVLITDALGKAFVFFSCLGGIYEVESIDKGKSWTKPLKVSGSFPNSKAPAAVLSDGGDIHLVWESAGKILYRLYAAQLSTWSTITAVNAVDGIGSQPVVTAYTNKFIYIVWVEQGEIVCKLLDLPTKEWGRIESVSLDSLLKLKAIPGAAMNPTIVVDQMEKVHVVWTNKNQIIHRVREKGHWQSAHSRLSNKYFTWVSQPAIIVDQMNMIYVSYIEDNAVIISQYDSLNGKWQKSNRIAPKQSVLLFSSSLAGNTSVSSTGLRYQTGYDLAWIERNSSGRSLKAKILFNSKAQFASGGNGPAITTVTNENGMPAIAWAPNQEQSAVQIIINNRPTPEDPVLYDSKKIASPETSYLVNNFKINAPVQYIFVRTQNLNGEWSAWSTPYQLKTIQESAGPELEITGIDEDSLYLYSPDNTVLYFGKGLEEPKEFIIRGTVKDKGNGIKKLTFSPAFGNQPPPLYDLSGENWAVRYTIGSKDEPGTIIIAAYDNEGQYTSKVVSIVKDVTAPEPPLWVKVFRNQNLITEGLSQNVLFSNSQTFFATWQDGKDTESGLRYHLMGTHAKWWQNQVHTSGDTERGVEGLNTVAVFAVDNVGNISLPGTAKIFIDSLPPDQPKVLAAITSSNYFYGTRSSDTVDVWVNGQHEADMEMISTANWRYRHRLHDGEAMKYTLQAIDGLKNKSKVIENTILFDQTPPRIYSVEHNGAGRILRAKDVLRVTVRGDVSSNAFMRLGNNTNIPLFDDGTRGDERANDGVYTLTWVVPADVRGTLDVVASLFDDAGNRAERVGAQVQIDSLAPQAVDSFEETGERYPWTNHCQAGNVFPARDTDPGVEAAEGKAVLRINYDLKDQGWAGLSSAEFAPRNYYGARPYVSFWLKGAGSHARIMIVLQGQQRKDIDFKDPQMKQASVSLSDTRWQKVSIPVPIDLIEPLAATVKYSVYIFSDDEQDSGVVYIDDLRVTYKPEAVVRKVASPLSPGLSATPSLGERDGVRASSVREGEIIPAPYVQLELSPQPVVRGTQVTIKVPMPKNIAATKVYAVFGTLNGEPQKTVLTGSADTIVWRGVYVIPKAALGGEQFGILYIQDKSGVVYKKLFTYKVIDAQSSIYDAIVANVNPHPAIAGKDLEVKVTVPLGVKSAKVVVFFGADQQKVYSVSLSKTVGVAGDVWRGTTTIPVTMAAGNYSANILIKTKDNRFVRSSVSYAVIVPSAQ